MYNPFEGITRGTRLRISDALHEVEQVNTYREQYDGATYWWYELELRGEDGAQCFLEWDEDDRALYLYGTPSDPAGVGLSPAMLEQFDDDEKGSFKFEGVTYYYEDSGDAVCFEGCPAGQWQEGMPGAPFYYYEFQDDSASLKIYVEDGEQGQEVHLGMRVDQNVIGVA